MGPKPVSFLLAEGVSFDQLTSRMTAFNILEVIFAAEIPSLMNKLAVACTYDMGPEPADFFERAELKAPDNSTIWHSDINVHIAARAEPGAVPSAHRTVHGIWNVILSAAGDYTLVLSHAPAADGPWEAVAQRRLTVVKKAHPIFGPSAKTPAKE